MYIFYFIFLLSFCGTYYVLPHSIRKLRESGHVAKDMYKFNKTLIPTNAGMILMFTSFISISLTPLLIRLSSFVFKIEFESADLTIINLALISVVSLYALYGLVDDLVDIGRILKVLLPISFGYPLISVIHPSLVWFPFIGDINLDELLFGDVTKSDIFRIVVIPVYVMVVANLVNMHSGYNGLQSGLSLLIISTLCVKSSLDGIIINILPASSILGSIFAFWLFNKYPSKVFEGNIGSLMFGSFIGGIIVVQQYWWFGFFILIPHTFNFILWLIWLIKIKKNPDEHLVDGKHKKFGTVDKNNIIQVPNMLTLKWIPNALLNLNEKHSTFLVQGITLVFCIIGLILFN